jgi:hypothetical protein
MMTTKPFIEYPGWIILHTQHRIKTVMIAYSHIESNSCMDFVLFLDISY